MRVRCAPALAAMSPLMRSLFALAAAALLQGACATTHPMGDARCTTILNGNTNGRKVDLAPVHILPGDRMASVVIGNPCGHTPFGEQVTVCDDYPPDVTLPPLPQVSPANVVRRGSCAQKAPVYTTMWC